MLAVVRGEEHDRVPFVQYDNVGAPNEEVWALIGRDNMGILRWPRLYRWENANCQMETVGVSFEGKRGLRRTMHTPVGSITEKRIYQPTYDVIAFLKHFVKEPRDYEVLLAYHRDAKLHECLEEIEAYNAQLGDDGHFHVSVDRTPHQQLWTQ